MTRKDYVMIANVIRETLNDIARDYERETISDNSRTLLVGERICARDIAYRLADQLRQDNPRFDTARFIEACGLTA
jgi:hypothetical protein